MSRVMGRRVMRRRPKGPSQSTGRSRGRSTQGRTDMMRRLVAQRSFANRTPPKPAQGPQGKSKLVKSTRTPARIAAAKSKLQKRVTEQQDKFNANMKRSQNSRKGKSPTLKRANVSPTTPTSRKPPMLKRASRRRVR